MTDLIRNLCVVRTERLSFEEVLGEVVKQTIARGVVDVVALGKPPVTQIIDVIATVRIIRQRIVGNRVIFDGEVFVKIVYEAAVPTQPVFVVDLIIPFSDSVVIDGIEPGARVIVRAEVEDVSVELIRAPGEPAAKKLSVTVIVQVFVKVVKQTELDVAVDVTGPPGLIVKKELLKVRTLFAEVVRQIIVRDIINLEELGKPPFVQLVDAIARARIETFRVLANKIVFEGSVEVKILYATVTQQVVVVAVTIPFKDFIDVPGARPGQDAELSVVVEHVSVVGEDRDRDGDIETLIISVVLKITARVFERREVRVVVDVRGIAGIEVDKQLVRAEEVLGEGFAQVVIREILDPKVENKPCPIQVIDCRAFPRIVRTEVIPNKVIVHGTVELKAIYEAVGQTANVLRGDFTFQTFVDIPGVQPGSTVTTFVRVVDVSCQVPPGLGPDHLKCPPIEVTAILEVVVRAVEGRQIEVVLDVFCPKDKAVCEGIILANRVNVRAGPSTAFPVIAQVNAGDRVTVLEQVGDWFRVRLRDMERTEGFIFRRFVKHVEKPLG